MTDKKGREFFPKYNGKPDADFDEFMKNFLSFGMQSNSEADGANTWTDCLLRRDTGSGGHAYSPGA